MTKTKTEREQAEAFFRAQAGFSYDPKTQTPADGRRECAKALANAEAFGRTAGLSFEWERDDLDSSEFSNEQPPWQLWACACHDANGKVVASLCGIDFGRDGSPWSDPYRRVVEAELAAEVMDSTPTPAYPCAGGCGRLMAEEGMRCVVCR